MPTGPRSRRSNLRSHPYIVHLVGFRTTLLRELGGFDGSSAHLAGFRPHPCASGEGAHHRSHIPEILYQWAFARVLAGTQRMTR
jgi:hypothetical protein